MNVLGGLDMAGLDKDGLFKYFKYFILGRVFRPGRKEREQKVLFIHALLLFVHALFNQREKKLSGHEFQP